MCTVLIVRHSIADLQHIGVVPMSLACIGAERIIEMNTLHDTELRVCRERLQGIESTPDVRCCSPAVTYFPCPFPWLAASPFAHTEENGSSGITQRIAHQLISTLCIDVGGVTPVVFQIA